MIMSRIKILLLTLALMFGITEVNAQSFQLKDLIGKTWVGVSGYNGCEYIDWRVSFTENKSVHVFSSKKKDDQPSVFTYNMYLTDVEPKSYDASLLGLKQRGKYVVSERKYIFKGEECEDFSYSEILSLTTNRLVVKSNGLTITFEAQ